MYEWIDAILQAARGEEMPNWEELDEEFLDQAIHRAKVSREWARECMKRSNGDYQTAFQLMEGNWKDNE